LTLYLQEPWNQVGHTPLIKVGRQLYAKLETVNPTGSIKDRIIKYIVERAIKAEQITSDTTLVEATSGNTGIALAALGASLGLHVKIIMPGNMSEERKSMMRIYGADIIEVADSDFEAAISMRNEMVADGCWSPMQFENSLNIECHRNTTAIEIINQLPQSTKFSAFVSGAGTGGTIMGIRELLIARGLDTQVCMVKPAEPSHLHGIQGISDGANFLANPDLCDHIFPIRTVDAHDRALEFAKTHGVLIGISAGANLLASEIYIEKYNPSGSVVTILCDRGERYLSRYTKA
jgi:cysteine synthase A